LGAGTGIGRPTGTAAGNRVGRGREDSFQVTGTAMGTGHFHFILLIYHQDFHVFVTVQAFEFEYGHFDLLMEKSF